jgi:thiamine-monophosphate kinase
VTRAGARPGDDVVVAGNLGRSAAGLARLQRGERAGADVDLHRRPEPPYALGPALARAGATALCDVSDGLLADLGHVATASGVHLSLDSALLRAAAPGVDLQHVLAGGEDHALAGAVPAGTPLPAGVHRVGTVSAAVGSGPAAVLVDGEPRTGGWEHFS